ncbi:MAG TPA: penicillin-binding protein [Flavobacteriales bacterium]|jgi:penicillin-binding protein 1A|nr:penicillin-binding protein [Flavobacteriales bacterium]
MKNNSSDWVKRIVVSIWVILILIVTSTYLFFLFISNGTIWEMPSFKELENPTFYRATEVFTSDQEVLGRYYRENRTFANFNEIPQNMIDALVATEDERFYNHAGIDFRRTFTAALFLGSRGGASTLTQQLAKQLYHEPAGNIVERIKQKFIEWVISFELEKRYTKDEIIMMYLNKFDFINNAVGANSAAEIYFNKPLDSLSLEESAVLIGMCKNPWLYNPVRFPEKAKFRRNIVFGQMARNGYITENEKDSLSALPMKIDFHPMSHTRGNAPYFREILRAELTRILNEKDENGQYIYAKPDSTPYDIYRDGLKVYTTIDSRLQVMAERAVERHLKEELQKDFDNSVRKRRNPPFSNDLTKKEIEMIMESAIRRSPRYAVMTGVECPNCGRRGNYVSEIKVNGVKYWKCSAPDCLHQYHQTPEDSILASFDVPTKMKVFSWSGEKDTVMTPRDSILYYKAFLQSGLMSMDPNNGEIKAWVGGINYKYFQYDHVRQGKRQVGSTFKPFVYTLAIQNGLDPCYEVPNVPTTFKKGEWGILKDWTPKNSDGTYGQMVTLKYGLSNSMNTITAWVMKQFGPAAVVDQARRMGITSPLDTVPSLALGVADVNLFEMVGAMSTFVNKGIYQKPIFLKRITDKNGIIIADFSSESNEAMSESDAYAMLNILEGVTQGAYGPYTGKEATKKGQMIRVGTGVRLHSDRPYGNLPRSLPIAGKTGTTQNNSDGWFIGLTPDLVTGVWVGAEDRSVRFSRTYYGQGANTALPIWGYYMKEAWTSEEIGLSKEPFEKPAGYTFPEDCSEVNSQDFPDFGD